MKTDKDGQGRTRTDKDGQGRTRTDKDGQGWTRTDKDGQGRTRTDKGEYKICETYMAIQYYMDCPCCKKQIVRTEK